MTRRLRPGPASGPKVLGVVAAAGLVLALVLTGRLLDFGDNRRSPPASPVSTTAGFQAPEQTGSNVQCPPGWPVLAMSDHSSYPAGHPARPPATASAVGCYRTAVQAAAAGYAPAPPPPGVLEVGGVYLLPTDPAFRVRCQQVADRLGIAVPCPGMLPPSPPEVPLPRLCEEPSRCWPEELVFAQPGFVVPFGFVGAPGGYGALVIVARPDRGLAGQSVTPCRNEHRIATPAVHGIRAVLAACSDDSQESFFGQSVLLRWSERGSTVVVSVLGHSEVNQRLVVVLATHLRLTPSAEG